MADKKKFLLRMDGNIHAALEKWAADELRSINAQIEYILTDSLKKSGRLVPNDSNINNQPDSSAPIEED